MRKAIIALGLAAGLATSQAQVFLNVGDAQPLGPVLGIGSGGVVWTAPATVAVGIVGIPAVSYGFIVDASTGLIVAALTPGSGPPTLAFGDFSVGVPAPLVNDNVTPYYLIIGDDTGGVVPFVGGPVTDLEYTAVKTESFVLVPEPGTYALLAGLGLVGFAGYRRFRS